MGWGANFFLWRIVMTKDKKSAAGKRDLHPEMMGDGNKIRSLIPPIAEFASRFARSRTLKPAVAAPTKDHLSGTCAQK
jgi:hypothetical protein